MADTSAPALRPGGGGHWVTINGHPVFLTGPAIPLGLRPHQSVDEESSIIGQAGKDSLARMNSEKADRAKADGLAKEFGFPPDRVDLNYGTPEQVVIGGRVLGREAGHYDPQSDRIVIDMQGSDPLNPGTMAHEVMHAKYQRVMMQYRQERYAYGERYPGRSLEAPLGETSAREFPTFAALHGDLEGNGLGRLAGEDGVSAYSHDYWVDFERPIHGAVDRGELSRKADTAMTETQAEWNRMEYETTHGIKHGTLAIRDNIRARRPHQYRFYQHLTSEYARLGPG